MSVYSSTVASARVRHVGRAVATLLVVAILLLTGQVARAGELDSLAATDKALIPDDPLYGRFGSSRDDFEFAHGGPVDDAQQAYPLGQTYDIFDDLPTTGYGYFEEDRLIYLTLVPEQGTWDATFGLMLVIDAIMPVDSYDQLSAPELDSTGEIGIQHGHSDALAAAIDPDVYDAFDITGEPGDFYILVQFNDEDDATSVEFALGSEVQDFDVADDEDEDEDEDEDAAGDSRAAEDEYLATLTSSFEELNESIDRFYAVVTGPTFGDAESTNELIDIFATWNSAHRDAQYMTPPPGYEEIHEAYLGFTGALVAAASDVTWGNMDSAAAEFAVAQEQAEILVGLLEDASRPDIFDVKSGYAKP